MRRKKVKPEDQFHPKRGSAHVAGKTRPKKTVDTRICDHCHRPGHISNKCYRNPESESYKGPDFGKDKPDKGEGSKAFKKKNPVLAMAFASSCSTDTEVDMDEDFILDSGASHHICADLSLFHSTSNIPEMSITLADESTVTCNTVGKIDLYLDSDNGESTWVRLNDALYIEEICMNLISPSVLDQHGITTIFGNGECRLVHKSSNDLIGTASKNSGGLYKVLGHVKRNLSPGTINIATGLDLWHKRLAHLPYRTVKSMAKQSLGINLTGEPDSVECTDCVETKSKSGSHKGTLVKPSAKLGSTVYTDVCGPFPTPSWGKGKSFITFTEAKSRYLHVMILRKKSEVAQTIMNYITLMERQHGVKIQTIHSDQGGEFVNTVLKEFYAKNGIVQVHSTANPPIFRGCLPPIPDFPGIAPVFGTKQYGKQYAK